MIEDPIAHAARLLRAGKLVAFPTETVYGLGADASQADAVRRIFAVKRRPHTQPLTVHIGRTAEPEQWAHFNPGAMRLVEALWPGPLTLILPKKAHVPDIVVGGGETVGLRMPAHPLCLDLLDQFGGGVAAPSANRHKGLSPTEAAHVHAELGSDVDFILDGGPCPVGIESTVLSLAGPSPVIFRSGAIPAEQIQHLLGCAVEQPKAPSAGYQINLQWEMLPESQWAARLLQNSEPAAIFSKTKPKDCSPHHWIELPNSAQACGAMLFGTLRTLHAQNIRFVIIEPLPVHGAWAAIHDRLQRIQPHTPR